MIWRKKDRVMARTYMRKYTNLPVLAVTALGALTLVACDRPAEERREATVPETAQNVSATIISPPPLVPSATTTDELAVVRKNDVLDASWRMPNVMKAYPAVLTAQRQAAEAQMDKAHKAATDDRQAALAGSYPFRPHTYQDEWQVVGQTPKLEILQGESYVYTGGAHGGTVTRVLFIDRSTGTSLTPVQSDASDGGAWAALFSNPAVVQDSLRVPFCKELERQWFAKRGAVDAAQQTGPFWECPQLAPQPFVPVVENGRITALKVILGEYVAGPYAEGMYEVPVPVTQDVLTQVKPAYREEFQVVR